MIDFCMEIIAPLITIIAFILIVTLFICLILEVISRVKEARNKNNVCDEAQEIDNTWTVNKAIIVLGNEKIEIEVECCNLDDISSIDIKSKDGKRYLTDIKNVLLMSE